jgi:hypothetical protein
MMFSKWLSTIMLACIRIREYPEMKPYTLMFNGFNVQVIGLGYFPRNFMNDNK